MLVDEQFRKSVAFLYVDRPSQDGVLKREAVATTVLVGVGIGGDYHVPYAVTNVHVVSSMRPLGTGYLRLNIAGTGFQDLPIDPDAWTMHHSTDVAVARIPSFESGITCLFLMTCWHPSPMCALSVSA